MIGTLVEQMKSFVSETGQTSNITYDNEYPIITNEFWTAKQRQGHSIHEITYLACFKPQLPEFFIQRLTSPNDLVYDPFGGRGTTAIQAVLMGRRCITNDINPLSNVLVEPRLTPVKIDRVIDRLDQIDFHKPRKILNEHLLVFYHPDTLLQIENLQEWLLSNNTIEDKWIRMIATNRLSGHSGGFFSVRSLPPNQAVSIDAQKRLNTKNCATFEPKCVKTLIIKKTRALLRDGEIPSLNLVEQIINCPAAHTPTIRDNSVDLVVTSPPFLDVIDYAGANWLRSWFNNIPVNELDISMFKRVDDWNQMIYQVLLELKRVIKDSGCIVFEVGEVKKKIKLDEQVCKMAQKAGLNVECVLINQQDFTKTSHIWGVKNNQSGTNTNRLVILTK